MDARQTNEKKRYMEKYTFEKTDSFLINIGIKRLESRPESRNQDLVRDTAFGPKELFIYH